MFTKAASFPTGILIVILAVVCLGYAAPIDDFSTPQGPAIDSTNDGVFTSSTLNGPIAGTVVPPGGSRVLGVSKTNNASGSVEAEIFPGAALHDALGAVTSALFIEYDNLGGVDLSAFDKLTLTGSIDSSAASGSGTTLGILVEDTSLNSASSDFVLNAPGPFQQDVPFGDFGGVDLSQIGRLRLGSFNDSGMFVDIPPGGDITLQQFEANVEPAAIPEPASIAMWIIVAALAACAAWRGRCRKSSVGG